LPSATSRQELAVGLQDPAYLFEDLDVILHALKITKAVAQDHDHIKSIRRIRQLAGVSFLEICRQAFV